MRMGNLLSGRIVSWNMATRNHSVGIDHVTVVPKPAAPTDEPAAEDDDDADED